jgi:hypothetical protein
MHGSQDLDMIDGVKPEFIRYTVFDQITDHVQDIFGFFTLDEIEIIQLAPSGFRSLWMVFASYPVASLIRFAARPVGAARGILTPRAWKILRMELMIVVLAVPGCPVSTMTLD